MAVVKRSKQPSAGVTAKSALWVGVPDKTHAASAAVATQLHKEGHWPPNDMTKVMGSDYRYDQFTLDNFLEAVQWNLQHGTPPYTFTYNEAFVKKGVSVTVGALIVAIVQQTT
jgi:hypothetical protein